MSRYDNLFWGLRNGGIYRMEPIIICRKLCDKYLTEKSTFFWIKCYCKLIISFLVRYWVPLTSEENNLFPKPLGSYIKQIINRVYEILNNILLHTEQNSSYDVEKYLLKFLKRIPLYFNVKKTIIKFHYNNQYTYQQKMFALKYIFYLLRIRINWTVMIWFLYNHWQNDLIFMHFTPKVLNK